MYLIPRKILVDVPISVPMRHPNYIFHLLRSALLVALIGATGGGTQARAGSQLYWCPDRPTDRQYSATPAPGCRPFVDDEEKKKRADRKPDEERPPIKAQNLQSEASDFLKRYRQFVECCSTNPESLEELKSLADRATDLLEAAQNNLFSEQMKIQSHTAGQMIQPVARARDNLQRLEKRLRTLSEAQDKLPDLDFEATGRQRRRIQDEEEAIRKEFRPTLPPESAKTGTEISDTTTPNRPGTLSQDTTLPNTTGTDFGNTTLRSSTGTDVGTTPSTGGEIGHVPSTGTEIGTTGRVGSSIGDSDLNQRR